MPTHTTQARRVEGTGRLRARRPTPVPTVLAHLLLMSVSALPGDSANAEQIAFFVAGDTQLLAELGRNPYRLDPVESLDPATRFVETLNGLPGTMIPVDLGGGAVSHNIRGMMINGDLIDSGDKTGFVYPQMQQVEWNAFQDIFGLDGTDGDVPFPVYEMHGNHDHPDGDNFVIDGIIERNIRRPGVTNLSSNGLHYSWDWGPVHFVSLGIFAGETDGVRPGHHYAPRESLAFLREDLADHVGDSGRPVVVGHHLHLTAGDYDWPDEDLAAFYEVLSGYQTVAMFHGHTHGSPPSRTRWNGEVVSNGLPTAPGVLDVFNPDDASAAHSDRHGLLYVEINDHAGVVDDSISVRSYYTQNDWRTAVWGQRWDRAIAIPDRVPEPAGSGTLAVLAASLVLQRRKIAKLPAGRTCLGLRRVTSRRRAADMRASLCTCCRLSTTVRGRASVWGWLRGKVKTPQRVDCVHCTHAVETREAGHDRQRNVRKTE